MGRRSRCQCSILACFGQTGVGKTKLLKYMLAQAEQEGFSVLIFDSKVTGAEFEGIGTEIPFYLEETTDPDVFRSLIEGMRTKGKGNMERFRGGFIEVCDGTKTFGQIGKRLEGKLSDPKIKGYTKAMYSEIFYDYKRLMELIGEFEFASGVQDFGRRSVRRMPTWKLPNLALQGLVVKSTVERLLHGSAVRKLIVLVDEAPNFVPQAEYSPAKSALQRLDSQGRSHEIYGWYSGQTLTGFDKRNMKNLWYWIIGREMENNEARDAWRTQTSKVVKLDGFRTLKVREFVAISPEFTKLVTVPLISGEEGRRHPGQGLGPEFQAGHDKAADDFSAVERRIEELEVKLNG